MQIFGISDPGAVVATVERLCWHHDHLKSLVQEYDLIVAPIVQRWLKALGGATQLYALGLFSNLSRDKGLSISIRFYPTLPLLQIIRGEAGVALYAANNLSGFLRLRPESKFHTTLTHSSGLRARLVDFPLAPDFVRAFQTAIEAYDHTPFGVIADLNAEDFCIRHGYSDQLLPLVEVSCA